MIRSPLPRPVKIYLDAHHPDETLRDAFADESSLLVANSIRERRFY